MQRSHLHLLHTAGDGIAPTAERLALNVPYAVHHPGISRPSEVTREALRHTDIAFLLR